jgi:hypothetical protein
VTGGGVVATAARLLTFRVTRDELLGLDRRHLAFGIAVTWLVGIGRTWDNPRATLMQHTGLGSVVYVFVLSALLWAVVAPLRPDAWTYRRLLTFVTLTAPPGLLYAIPVEKFLSMSAARSMNMWFLLVVAAWRVALLAFYLTRLARLRWYQVLVTGLLPLTLIVTALALLNLDHVVFSLMGGLSDKPSPNDDAYAIVVMLSLLSTLAFPPLVLLWGAFAFAARKRIRGGIREPAE